MYITNPILKSGAFLQNKNPPQYNIETD